MMENVDAAGVWFSWLGSRRHGTWSLEDERRRKSVLGPAHNLHALPGRNNGRC